MAHLLTLMDLSDGELSGAKQILSRLWLLPLPKAVFLGTKVEESGKILNFDLFLYYI